MNQHTQHSNSSPRGGQVGAKELTAIVLLACGIIMAFIALMLPPPGEIHDSVLYIFAQIFIYCGSIFGIDSYINHKIKDRNANNKHPNDYD